MGLLEDIGKGLERLSEVATTEARARHAAWQALAARRRGLFTAARPGLLGGGRPTVDLVVEDVAVHLDMHTVRTRNNSTTYTRFRAGYLLPVGPVYRVVPDNIVSSLGTALGFEDVVLGGDPAFDARFVVRTADAVATRLAWSPALKALALRHFPAASVEADGHVVRLSVVGRLADLGRLEAGVDLVAALAAYGASWVAALRQLPGALWVPPRGPWDSRTPPAVRVDQRGVPLWIHPVLSGMGLTFCATAALQRELPAFEASLDPAGRLEGQAPADLEAPARLAAFGAAAPATLSSDGRHARLVLHGAPNERRLLAAASALADLALGAAPQGAYR